MRYSISRVLHVRSARSDLNRALYFCLIAATHRGINRSELTPGAPVPEGRNPPFADDLEYAPREGKIPDFQWTLVDHLEPDPYRAARTFVVECKRLDQASRNWILTEQYVSSGVARFFEAGHGYGAGVGHGAMVGYVQRLVPRRALQEVNDHLATAPYNIGPLRRTPKVVDAIHEFDHSFDRTFAVTPFYLQHLWVQVSAK